MGEIKSRILKDAGLLLQEYTGDLKIKDMLEYFDGLYKNPDYLSVSSIFSDFTTANVMLSAKDISEIADFILHHAPKIQHIRNSIVTSKPLVTAYSMIYETLMKEMPLYECRIFSTYKEAAIFIMYDLTKLEEVLKRSFNN